MVENNALTPPAPQRISAAWRVRGGCGYERSARWKKCLRLWLGENIRALDTALAPRRTVGNMLAKNAANQK